MSAGTPQVAAFLPVRYPGVVDQHVEAPEALGEEARQLGHVLWTRYIKTDRVRVSPGLAHLRRGLLALAPVTGSEHHGQALLAQLAGNLQSESFVGTGY